MREQIESSQYPLDSVTPIALVNSFGGVIDWAKWINRVVSDVGVEITAMVFADGTITNGKGRTGHVELGNGEASRDQMRAFANG